MKKYWFIVYIFLFMSCKHRDNVNDGSANLTKDSISLYYEISKDQKISLSIRSQKINRALVLLSNNETDTLLTKVLFQKNLIHFASNEYDSLLIYSNQLVNFATQIKDERILAEQYYLMGYYYAETLHQYAKAIEKYTISKEFSQQLKDSSKVGRNLLNIGTIQKDQNDFLVVKNP